MTIIVAGKCKNGVIFLSDDISINVHQRVDKEKLFRREYREKIFYDDNFVLALSTNNFDVLATNLGTTPFNLGEIIEIAKNRNASLIVYDRKGKKFYTENREDCKKDVYLLGSGATQIDSLAMPIFSCMSYQNVGHWFKGLLEALSVSVPEIGHVPQIVVIDEEDNLHDYRKPVANVYERLNFPNITSSQEFEKETRQRKITSFPSYIVAMKYKTGVIFATDSVDVTSGEKNYRRKIFSLSNGVVVPKIKFAKENRRIERVALEIKRTFSNMLAQSKGIDETRLAICVKQLEKKYQNLEFSLNFSVKKDNDIKLCHAVSNNIYNFDFFFDFKENDWLSKNSAELFLVERALEDDREAQRILDVSISDGSMTLEDALKILKWIFPLKYRPQFVVHALDEGIKDYVNSSIRYYQMIEKEIDEKYQKIVADPQEAPTQDR